MRFSFFSILLCGIVSTSLVIGAISESDKVKVEELRLKVLEELSQNCFSKWCLGDYHYQFKNIQCNANKKYCKLYIDIKEQVVGGDKDKIQNFNCTLNGYRSFNDILNKKSKLQEPIIKELDKCISRLEEQIEFNQFQ